MAPRAMGKITIKRTITAIQADCQGEESANSGEQSIQTEREREREREGERQTERERQTEIDR